MKVLILAGGYATRLWPLTKEKAKPLLLVNGKPLITHIVEKIPKSLEITVATNKKFEKAFRKWRLHFLDRKIDLLIEPTVFEGEKLGAAGAVAHFIKEKNVGEDLLVLGGDNYFEFSIRDFLKDYRGLSLIAAYNVGSLKEAKKFGVLKVKGPKVISFKEKPESPESTLASTFIYIFPASIFPLLFEFLKTSQDQIGKFIEYLIKKTYVQAYITTKHWFDIGSFEGYLLAHRKAKKRGKGEFWGVDFFGDNTLKGRVFIDKGTAIKNCQIKDSIILSNCRIENAVIKNSIIDEGASIKGCLISSDIIQRDTNLKCHQDVVQWRKKRA